MKTLFTVLAAATAMTLAACSAETPAPPVEQPVPEEVLTEDTVVEDAVVEEVPVGGDGAPAIFTTNEQLTSPF